MLALCSDIAAEHGAVLEAVNFNSPGQIVIAGHSKLQDTAVAAFKANLDVLALPCARARSEQLDLVIH